MQSRPSSLLPVQPVTEARFGPPPARGLGHQGLCLARWERRPLRRLEQAQPDAARVFGGSAEAVVSPLATAPALRALFSDPGPALRPLTRGQLWKYQLAQRSPVREQF